MEGGGLRFGTTDLPGMGWSNVITIFMDRGILSCKQRSVPSVGLSQP